MRRRMDHLGRIVVPREYVKELNFEYKQMVDITVSGRSIQIRRAEPCCCICGHQERLSTLNDYTFLCSRCIINILERFHTPISSLEATEDDLK